MSKATIELDLFGMEKDIHTPKSSFLRRRSLRDIQGMINPELLKSSISNANNVPRSPEEGQKLPLDLPLPILSPLYRHNVETGPETGLLTIFYNGTVSVFDVPKDKAETILKFAEGTVIKTVELAEPIVPVAPTARQQLLETVNGDLPITRRKSLQRFLEKRKERLTSVSPLSSSPNTPV